MPKAKEWYEKNPLYPNNPKTQMNLEFLGDNYQEAYSGIGSAKQELGTHAKFSLEKIDFSAILGLIRDNNLWQRILTHPANVAYNKDLEIAEDVDGEIQSRLLNHDFYEKFSQARALARIYGGCVLFIQTDSANLEMPLDTNTETFVNFLIFNASEIFLDYENDRILDITNPKFGQYEYIYVMPYNNNAIDDLKKEGERIHSSRFLFFKSMFPKIRGRTQFLDSKFTGSGFSDINNSIDFYSLDFWGFPESISLYNSVKNFVITMEDRLPHALQCYFYDIVKLRGMSLSSTSKKKGIIQKMIEFVVSGINTHRKTVVGNDEEIERLQLDLDSFVGAIEKQQGYIAATVGWPQTEIFGQSPKGMNATGESDQKIFQRIVNNIQKNDTKNVQFALNFIAKDVFPEGVNFRFPAIEIHSQKEVIQMRETQSKIDSAYIATGAVLPEDIIRNRFEGGYSFETKLEAIPTPTPEEIAAQISEVEGEEEKTEDTGRKKRGGLFK